MVYVWTVVKTDAHALRSNQGTESGIGCYAAYAARVKGSVVIVVLMGFAQTTG